MEPDSLDAAVGQFVSKDEFGKMGQTFSELAQQSANTLRIPRNKAFDRQQVVQAFQEAFELIGGVPALAYWGAHNRTEFYKLYGKLLPQANVLDVMGKMEHHILPALPPSPLDDLPPPIEGEKVADS
jgi:hypothetical protein